MKRNTIVKTAFSMLSEEEARAIYSLVRSGVEREAEAIRTDQDSRHLDNADFELLRKFVEKTERVVENLEN